MLVAAVSACGVGLEAELYAIEHFNPVLCRQMLALTTVADRSIASQQTGRWCREERLEVAVSGE